MANGGMMSATGTRTARRAVKWSWFIGIAAAALLATAGPASAGVPSAPAKPTVTADNASVDVSWSTVTATPAVTAYSVATLNSEGTVLIDTLSVDAASGDTASVTVTGLTNGTSYTFKILARNADGNSDYSEISTSATPRTVADAPGIPTLVAADEQITATWTAPASNNGAEITGYTATASTSGSSAGTCSTTSATDLDCAITSLTNGTSYEVTVTAANSAGNSNASAGAAATPSTTPGAPTGVGGPARPR